MIKQLRKWRFFAAVAVLHAYSCFPVRMTAPLAFRNAVSLPDIAPAAPRSLQPADWNVSSVLAMIDTTDTYGPAYTVTRSSVWIYVDGTFQHLSTAEDLAISRYTRNSTSSCIYDGWRMDGGPWEYALWPPDVIEQVQTYFHENE